MKYLLILFCTVALSWNSQAQNYIQFHHTGSTDTYQLYEKDSIYFSSGHTIMYFMNDGDVYSYVTTEVDSVTFQNDPSENIYIDYQGSYVNVINPWAGMGIDISVTGSDVVVTSSTGEKDVHYVLSGNTSDGSFKIYSEKRFSLILNEVSIVNHTGPAINIQSEKDATIHLIPGTLNYLSDGEIYDPAPVTGGVTEDQKATLFSEGDMILLGSGSLEILALGAEQHAIASDDDLIVEEGNITISGSARDGLHASEKLIIDGGVLSVQATGDGLDSKSILEINCGQLNIHVENSDSKGISSDSLLLIQGGTTEIYCTASQTKAIKADHLLSISDGSVTAYTSGDAILMSSGSGSEPVYSKLLASDGTISITGGILDLNTTGKGARAISADGNYIMNGGNVSIHSSGNGATYINSMGATDAYHSTGIKTNGSLQIIDGTLLISQSGTGGKAIDADGSVDIGDGVSIPSVSLMTSGNSITISAGSGGPGPGGTPGDYDESKALKSGATVTIQSGEITISSKDDGIKAAGSVVINNGNLSITNSYEAIESKYITVNGGQISLVATDDGFNATTGSGGEADDGSLLLIQGGNITVNASGGDALDSNGDITINGGFIVIHGPASSPEVGMDYNGTGLINGGFIVISGTNSFMTQGFNTSSSQRSLILKTNSAIAANTIFHLEDASGNNLVTFSPLRNYYSIVFSSDLLTTGTTYKIYTGGSSTGSVDDGLYSGGTYTPGTLEQTFTISGMVTTVNF